MDCSMHCAVTGTSCQNGDMGLVRSWTKALLDALNEQPDLGIAKVIKRCSKAHYDAMQMEETLKPYIGQPEAFYQFLHDTWNWIVTVNPDGKLVLADENKTECVCPLVRMGTALSPNLCNCSEGFAQRMFSTVLEKPVSARIRESILRGGTHCVYEITME